MYNKIKHSFKHSAIYSLGNITSKLIGIVLLPIYTSYFTVSQYGILGILEVTMFIMTQVLLLGQPAAYLRFYDLDEYKDKRKTTLFTILLLLLSTLLLFLIAGHLLIPKISSYFSQPDLFKIYFRLSLYIITLRVINNLFLNVLRAKEKVVPYVTINLLKITSTLSLNIYFIVVAKLGITGILYSYIIGESLTLLLLLPTAVSETTYKIDKKILMAAVKFGTPIIFSALSSMLLNVGDRYILKLLVNYKEVGLYDLGYRFANLLNVFLVQSFIMGYLPQAYKIYRKEGDKRYYSKMQTYLVFVLCWAGLGLSFFGKEIIHTFALKPEYWSAYKIIPVIALAIVFNGAKSVVNLGMLLKQKSQYIAMTTIIAAMLNIVLNFILIPQYKMMGAAFATLISFIIFYILCYIYSNKFYPIPYETTKFIKMLVVSLSLYGLFALLYPENFILQLALKILLLSCFPFILFLTQFYEPVEIEKMKEIGKALANRAVQLFYKSI